MVLELLCSGRLLNFRPSAASADHFSLSVLGCLRWRHPQIPILLLVAHPGRNLHQHDLGDVTDVVYRLSEFRLELSQSFQAIGSVVAPLLASRVFFKNTDSHDLSKVKHDQESRFVLC